MSAVGLTIDPCQFNSSFKDRQYVAMILNIFVEVGIISACSISINVLYDVIESGWSCNRRCKLGRCGYHPSFIVRDPFVITIELLVFRPSM